MKLLNRLGQAVLLSLAIAMIIAAGNLLSSGLKNLSQAQFFGPAMIQQNGSLSAFSYKENNAAKDPSKAYPIIRLKFKDKEGNSKFVCSAFVVSDKYAITAAHCIVDEGWFIKTADIFIADENDQDTGIVAQPAAVNIRVDYGLVKGNFKNFNKILLDDQMVGVLGKQGPVVSFGFPWGGDLMVSPLKLMPHISKMFMLHVVGPIYPGMSGGPTIDMGSGTAIGINSAVDEQAGALITPLINFFDAVDVEVKR